MVNGRPTRSHRGGPPTRTAPGQPGWGKPESAPGGQLDCARVRRRRSLIDAACPGAARSQAETRPAPRAHCARAASPDQHRGPRDALPPDRAAHRCLPLRLLRGRLHARLRPELRPDRAAPGRARGPPGPVVVHASAEPRRSRARHADPTELPAGSGWTPRALLCRPRRPADMARRAVDHRGLSRGGDRRCGGHPGLAGVARPVGRAGVCVGDPGLGPRQRHLDIDRGAASGRAGRRARRVAVAPASRPSPRRAPGRSTPP